MSSQNEQSKRFDKPLYIQSSGSSGAISPINKYTMGAARLNSDISRDVGALDFIGLNTISDNEITSFNKKKA